jgi:hypothetical protein
VIDLDEAQLLATSDLRSSGYFDGKTGSEEAKFRAFGQGT